LKEKREKEKEKPKRVMSALSFYFKEQFSKVKTPEKTAPECMKEIARRWKDLSDDKRGVYEKMHKKDIERKKKELVEYGKKNPKRKANDYAIFVRDNFKSVKSTNGGTVPEIMKILAQKWKKKK